MTRKLLDVLRVLVAVLAGNVAMSLLITLGFKWLGGVDFHTSSQSVLVLGSSARSSPPWSADTWPRGSPAGISGFPVRCSPSG